MDYGKAYNEIEGLWKFGKNELRINGEGEQLFSTETVEALHIAKTVLGSIEQILWERDLAISQLTELGYGLGEKISK